MLRMKKKDVDSCGAASQAIPLFFIVVCLRVLWFFVSCPNSYNPKFVWSYPTYLRKTARFAMATGRRRLNLQRSASCKVLRVSGSRDFPAWDCSRFQTGDYIWNQRHIFGPFNSHFAWIYGVEVGPTSCFSMMMMIPNCSWIFNGSSTNHTNIVKWNDHLGWKLGRTFEPLGIER